MANFYDSKFKVGVWISLCIWFVVNFVNLQLSRLDWEENGLKFSSSSGPEFDWGIPIYWTDAWGFVLNSVVIAVTSIVIGHITRAVWSRIGKRGGE